MNITTQIHKHAIASKACDTWCTLIETELPRAKATEPKCSLGQESGKEHPRTSPSSQVSNHETGTILSTTLPRRRFTVQETDIPSASYHLKSRPSSGASDPEQLVIKFTCRLIGHSRVPGFQGRHRELPLTNGIDRLTLANEFRSTRHQASAEDERPDPGLSVKGPVAGASGLILRDLASSSIGRFRPLERTTSFELSYSRKGFRSMSLKNRAPAWFAKLTATALAGFLVVAGCALDKNGNGPGNVITRVGGHSGQVIVPKRCLLKVAIVARSFGDPTINEVVWRVADEQVIPPAKGEPGKSMACGWAELAASSRSSSKRSSRKPLPQKG